ncbi:MAG: hypothetical protein KAR05_01435 [Candidatus Omnitrophica bacterium]|nr:hypothetical protein [Candidatus Omnitrophota bacterium]
MPFLIHIFIALIVTSFWAGIISFIPTTLFLLFINPRLAKSQRLNTAGIIILGSKTKLHDIKMIRSRNIRLIYWICFSIIALVYCYKWIQLHQTDLSPFNFLFAITIILFFVSVLTYGPLAVYLAHRYPHRYEEEGLCLEGSYIFSGVCVLIFCILYVFHWLKTHHLVIDFLHLVTSFVIVSITTAAVSYLPILVYIFLKIADPKMQKKIHFNIIFIVYSICFCISSIIYIIQWLRNIKLGITV